MQLGCDTVELDVRRTRDGSSSLSTTPAPARPSPSSPTTSCRPGAATVRRQRSRRSSSSPPGDRASTSSSRRTARRAGLAVVTRRLAPESTWSPRFATGARRRSNGRAPAVAPACCSAPTASSASCRGGSPPPGRLLAPHARLARAGMLSWAAAATSRPRCGRSTTAGALRLLGGSATRASRAVITDRPDTRARDARSVDDVDRWIDKRLTRRPPKVGCRQLGRCRAPPPGDLDPSTRRSTTDQVLHELRAAILAGRIKPREPLARGGARPDLRHRPLGDSRGSAPARPGGPRDLRAQPRRRSGRSRREDVLDVYLARRRSRSPPCSAALQRPDGSSSPRARRPGADPRGLGAPTPPSRRHRS